MLRCLAGLPLVIFGDGTQTRDFTYVSDTARGILLAGLANNTAGETINIGSGREIEINELASDVAEITEQRDARVVHDQPRPGDVLRLYADTSKAHELLGFEPQITLPEGLTKLQEWYQSLRVPAKKLLEDEIVHNWNLTQGVQNV
jgi:UDP-glucose 4-epimerase